MNRAGEFALIVDPNDEGHIVSVYALTRLLGALEQALQFGLRAQESNSPRIELFITTSPESGSIKIWLMVATVLSVGANLSQITGVDIRYIVEAISHTISPPPASSEPINTTTQIVADPHFIDSVTNLVEVAGETGYRSVRIEANGVRVELIERAPSDFDETVERLQHRLEALEEQLASLPPPPEYVDNVRQVDSQRYQIEQEINGIENQMHRLTQLKNRPR